MASTQIRSDYDGMKNIASNFNQNSDAISQVNQAIKGCVEQLQGGDWIGGGAQKFYQEMSSSVMPSMMRLQRALAEAARITNEISKIMEQAEHDASSVMHM